MNLTSKHNQVSSKVSSTNCYGTQKGIRQLKNDHQQLLSKSLCCTNTGVYNFAKKCKENTISCTDVIKKGKIYF